MPVQYFYFDDPSDLEGEQIEYAVTFSRSPYVPAQGPECPWGGQPAEGLEVIDSSIVVEPAEPIEAQWDLIWDGLNDPSKDKD